MELFLDTANSIIDKDKIDFYRYQANCLFNR